MIRTLNEANAALEPYIPLVAQLTGKDTTLRRIRPIMGLLNHPEEKLRVIHIAGTSGKTSTAYYMASLLHAAGKTVGLIVSPHVDKVTERLQINGEQLDEAIFCKELGTFLEIIQTAKEPPSYFELLYSFALWVLMKRHVDYVVVETGMGGLHDATNIVTREDKVCLITDIGFDHMHILGNTLSQIAGQKIGIVHKNNQVFCFEQAEEIMSVFHSWTKDHQAILTVLNEKQLLKKAELDTKDVVPYQVHNWLLAFGAYNFLVKRDKLPFLASHVLNQTVRIRIPGRIEKKIIKGQTVIMDGAHNTQKMKTFIASFKKLYPNTKPAVMIALKHDKAYQEVADLISDFASEIIVTTFQGAQDLPVHSMDPKILARAVSHPNVTVIDQPEQAMEKLLDTPAKIKVITGSFYLLSVIRKELIT
jgi:dihydrofolate synthase/folylpolyglutamate synthase